MSSFQADLLQNNPMKVEEPENEEDSAENSEMEPENEPPVAGGVLLCTHPGCLKEFSTRWSLNRHTRVHTGVKPYKCNFCHKEFAQNCSLKRHEQTHSQERVWVCDYQGCGKRFKLKEYLEVHHQRTHFKEEQSDPVAINISEMSATQLPGAPDPTQMIEKLRERLVRVSLRHHDQLQCHQHREMELLDALKEVADSLEESLGIIDRLTDGNPAVVPVRLQNVAKRYSTKNATAQVTPTAAAHASAQMLAQLQAQMQSQTHNQARALGLQPSLSSHHLPVSVIPPLSLPLKLEASAPQPQHYPHGYIPGLFSPVQLQCHHGSTGNGNGSLAPYPFSLSGLPGQGYPSSF